MSIRTSRVSWWRAGNKRASEVLAPPEGESTKSAWAFDLPDQVRVEELFTNAQNPRGSRLYQALNLYLADASPERNKVEGIAIPRSALPTRSVVEDRGQHLCEHHDLTHRSLHADGALRNSIRDRCFEEVSQSDLTWKYTANELVDLAQNLLERNVIRSAYLERARLLVAKYA